MEPCVVLVPLSRSKLGQMNLFSLVYTNDDVFRLGLTKLSTLGISGNLLIYMIRRRRSSILATPLVG
jgi:hypothetical protein